MVLRAFLSSWFRPPRHAKWTLLAAATLAALTAPARALSPDEIVILFNARSPNSLKVARYYAEARKIPITHIIGINCDPSEAITEQLYRTSFAVQVRKEFQNRKFEPSMPGVDGAPGGGGQAIKCIVTTYDVPLRIYAHQPTPAEAEEAAANLKQLDETLTALEKFVAAYDAIAPSPNAPAPATGSAPASAPGGPRTWQSVVAKLNVAGSAAGQRLERMSEPARSLGMADFISTQEKVAGIMGLLNSLQVAPGAPADDPGRRKLAELHAQLTQIEERYATVSKQINDRTARAEIVSLRLKANGLVGQARALEELNTFLKPEGTESCLDNELALVFSEQPYPLAYWVQNANHIETYPAVQRSRQAVPPGAPKPPTLPPAILVTRLDGESVAGVEAMIDTTLKVEAAGLEGKCYLDARGLHGADGYAVFDADLRRAADWLKQHSTMDVILDDKDALLQAKDCPDAALYCGWYSLHNYQDSCQWVKGAVGYHVASYEMPTLHTPNDQGWVPNLLKRGFCGTLGATDEPYLTAFPKPSQFFPLLLSGDFTQGEVWQVTAPMVSWRIGYVGDPLYNPFKMKPRVKTETLKADPVFRNAYLILRPPAAAAVTLPAPGR